MLVRLLYASRASTEHPITPALTDSILVAARDRNAHFGITGVLCVCPAGGFFLQLIEGGREAINRLYSNLLRDPRHTDVTMLAYEEITERKFASWRMGVVDLDRLNPSTVLRYAETSQLDPWSCSGVAAMALLDELFRTAAIAGGR